MKQIVLSIEQMKHLESLGLDTSDASMCYNLTTEGYELVPHEEPLATHIHTYILQDILEKLPNDYFHSCHITNTGQCILFEYMRDDTGNSKVISKEYSINNPLEASYQMLVWCIKNNYIV